MTLVKICGLTSVDDAVDAMRSGADRLGFVLAPGYVRSVEPDVVVEARAAMEAASSNGRMPDLVGVVVDECADHVRALVEAAGVDVVQLSGAPERALATFSDGGVPAGVRVIRTVHVGPVAPEQPRKAASDWERRGASVTFDAHVVGAAGGTGVVIDADLYQLADLCAVAPRGLAGGLTPDNVGAHAARVRPALVDVSSGVEGDVPGRKDPERVRAFVAAVRSVKAATP